MKYEKKALSLEDQADQLLERGLIADRAELMMRLQAVNYYRMSGYLHPYRIRDDEGKPTDNYQAGTTLEEVWRRYNFDRRLRIILLDAIERVEVAVRTRLVFHFTHAYGPFGYLEPENLPGLKSISEYLEWRGNLAQETKRAKNEQFVKHFHGKYGDVHREPPLWMLCELMSYGSMLRLASGVEPAIQQAVAKEFEMSDKQFFSWLKALYSVRNACAHHSRVWNRIFGVAPMTPHKNKFSKWHEEPKLPNNRVGYALAICRFWLNKITPTSQWQQRLFDLLDEYPEIPLDNMGLPDDWRKHPLFEAKQ